MNATPIQGFFGEHRFLSNFWPCSVTFDGVRYPSVEHAYQAAKTLDEGERGEIAACDSAGQAKRAGRKITIRHDWDSVKVSIMRHLVKQKFEDPHLLQLLLDTAPSHLEETNTWGDVFWGVCDGRGKNMLGKILMDIRDNRDVLEY